MRGDDQQLQTGMFSYVALEDRIPADHPLRAVRKLVDEVLAEMSKDFDGLYSEVGRPSIAPERLLRALLLQVFYSVRSERLLMEQLDYNLLFRWFVGLEMDEAVWNHAVFSKNRERLLTEDLRRRSSSGCCGRPRICVGRALHGGWDADRSLGQPEELSSQGRGRVGERSRFSWPAAQQRTHASTDPDARLYKKSKGRRPS